MDGKELAVPQDGGLEVIRTMLVAMTGIVGEMEKTNSRLADLEARADAIAIHQGGADDPYYSVLAFSNVKGLPVPLETAQRLGIMATRLCLERGLKKGTTHDPRFGVVGTYPLSVLEIALADYLEGL